MLYCLHVKKKIFRYFIISRDNYPALIKDVYKRQVFKEVTRRTPVDYINFIRCNYARNLLLSGRYNVSESAEMSGFKNLSYFSKTYKKYMGCLLYTSRCV